MPEGVPGELADVLAGTLLLVLEPGVRAAVRGGWAPLMYASKCLFATTDISLQRAVRGLQSLAGSLQTTSVCKYSS